ncbi:Cytochrome b5 heme-binding domain-containing protein [Mycena venus]|uniref:Cytochrome b5 heme-binding domain-containing protein n=1 Tax=Mycena venus TaxID=2733690 RepID=A0A8H7CAI4_9AGAR|nr:Cytochrome b5 heme-binding domain-containing protein [Mycena venus]
MVSKEFSRDAVAQHTSAGDLWVIIDSRVFDLSSFASLHPGGLAVLLDPEIAGQDATERFFELHRAEVLDRYARLQIGTVQGEQAQIQDHVPGSLSSVPYAEPTWLTPGYHSPYYKEHHHRFRAAVRKFVDEVVFPDAQARERDGGPPSREILDEMARLNITAMRVGPGEHLQGRVLMNGIISVEEAKFTRIHARGYADGLGGGTIIGLPPVINFAPPALRDKIVKDTLSGNKPICLAITEAFAGSDVQGLRCRARRTEDGWIVNGTKKWITNAMWAHYFTVACKADNGEIVILVVERGEGVQTRPIKTNYSSSTAGTAFVTFDNVRVPPGNQLGADQPGLNIILANFNHERWVLTAATIGGQRLIFEECFKWATQRKVFGKALSSQPVIRQKLAAMISRFESCQSWIENITFQMCRMSAKEQARHLAGQMAFLKMHATRASQATAADAVQIFGGQRHNANRNGPNPPYRCCRRRRSVPSTSRRISILTVAIAEDVLGDLGVRQAIRNMPARVRL